MDQLPEKSSLLFSRLPQITDLKELIDLSCSLMEASLYIVDGHGEIVAHSEETSICCPSWRSAVAEGVLNEEHRKSVLTPEMNCNVALDKACQGEPCARLSVPVSMGEGVLKGAVVFFLWNGDPSYEKQCLAMILAGALSNLLQKEKGKAADARPESLKFLKELLNYKPGLKHYFLSALKNSEFTGRPGPYRLCVILPWEDEKTDPEALTQRISALSERFWAFEHHGAILLLFCEEDYAPEAVCRTFAPIVEENRMQLGCSVGFDELFKLRYIYEDTLSALELAAVKEPETRFHRIERYLSYTLLKRCKKLLPVDEYYPDFFRRLIEHDERTGKTYLETLAAYLDNGRNTNAAAKQIYMHRNTMMQQLERIEQIIGVPLDDSETAFFLQLCIRLHELE